MNKCLLPLCTVFLYVYAFICAFLSLSMHPHTCKGTQNAKFEQITAVIFLIFTNYEQGLDVCYRLDPFSQFSSVAHRVRLFVTQWTAARQASLSITNSQSLLKLMSIELVMPSNHLILCRTLLLLPVAVGSYQLYVLYIVICIYQSQSPNLSLLPSPPQQIRLLSASVILILSRFICDCFLKR